MAHGDRDEFKNFKHIVNTYEDGTETPNLSFEVWRNGVYHGYVEVIIVRVKDGSISIRTTSRMETAEKPREP